MDLVTLICLSLAFELIVSTANLMAAQVRVCLSKSESELLFGALGREGVHEFGKADSSVQFVFVEAAEQALQLDLARERTSCGLLTQLGSLIQVALEVASKFA